LCNFFHSPVTSSLLGPNILLRTLLSNICWKIMSLNYHFIFLLYWFFSVHHERRFSWNSAKHRTKHYWNWHILLNSRTQRFNDHLEVRNNTVAEM
jgi:hypothetical protein